MDLSSKTLRLDPGNPADLLRAAEFLRDGQTVAFPTETVYGLGANALDPAAVGRIFEAKQRPSWDPLIVHVADSEMLESVAEVSPDAQRLIDRFWPGPLTLLLTRTAAIPDAVTAGRPLVGVRMPAHPVALALIAAAGVPIAAPSANRFGHTSPTTAQHVLDDLDGRIAAVLDGGATEVGLESTVIGLEEDAILIYRAGAITAEMLAEVAGPTRSYVPASSFHEPVESLPSPGVGIRHYAPRARLILVEPNPSAPEHSLLDELQRNRVPGVSVGAMLPDGWAVLPGTRFFAWGPWDDPAMLASRLFAGLRFLDDHGAETIVCPIPSAEGIGAAIRDRLEKAARTA